MNFVKGDSLIIEGYVDIGRLVSFLQSNTCIKKLFLVDLRVNAEEAKVLADINLTNLTSLHVKVDRILKFTYDLTVVERNLIVKVLSKALRSSEHPDLTSLHLEVVDIDDSGVRDLSKALKSGNLPNLTSLHVKVGNIGNFDAQALSKALKSGNLPNLTSLHVKVGNIGNFDAQALSKALKSGSLPSLTSLHLKGNMIDYGSVEALSKALKRKSSSEPEVSTASSSKSFIQRFKKSKSDESNNQASHQQGAQIRFDQPGPSSKLGEVLPISRGQSLGFLHSSDSDISRL